MVEKYPKITQEALEASAEILLNCLLKPNYLKEAPYSSLMIAKIEDIQEEFEKNIREGSFSVSVLKEGVNVDADIAERFSEINSGIETRHSEYQDKYGIVVRLEKIILNMETLATKGSSDTVKMTAMTKFMDFQQEQIKILTQLTNVAKAQKIESLTRRFFQEIRKSDQLKNVVDRYINLLNSLDD